MSPRLDYGFMSVTANDITVRGSLVAKLDHGTVHVDAFDMDNPLVAEMDHGSMHIDAFDLYWHQCKSSF